MLALQNGVDETNTLERLQILAQNDWLPRDLAADAADAYEFLLQVRLVHQLEQLERNLVPNNRVDPQRLSDLEKKTLKEAFVIVGKLQTFLKEQFRLHIG